MKQVLVLNSSLNGAQGNSSRLASQFVSALRQRGEIEVTERDLANSDLPHLGAEEMRAWATPADERDARQGELAKISDDLIGELQLADTLVVGMPLYNFGIPSVFKAWIDRIARAGITFKYTESGPQGLLQGKKVYVLAARGGVYAGTDTDTQSQYLKNVFAFVGLSDVEFIYAEGLAMGDKAAELAWAQADEKIGELMNSQAA
ncbi:FMN-dependent NADH-azoreductase [Parahaliea mediterranea]|uniref:FMN dependent NADH:quinone oxidoreductase n=1 Tax=Parahaliea mediterranea TaxID=651086 RepID=A0A939DBD4_9GAMM|nr:NAD(P)H-dependent oxidoreductase [Parahaliea mediterranea]MBN7794950.1 NAD(P)H-dependent oxidoreductase [Parahaliea mediterranea]